MEWNGMEWNGNASSHFSRMIRGALQAQATEALRIVSGIQPTGRLHLGNYLGAVRRWVELQHATFKGEMVLCVVDLHALTAERMNADKLRGARHAMVASLLACGLDTDKCSLHFQSQVPEHTELAWILGCITPLGWMHRMIQFKERSQQSGSDPRLGLLSYPVLQAADILLFKATHVPVGEDQTQHIELTRDVARVFNQFVHQDVFPTPRAVLGPTSARIMSLSDGRVKMSKSLPSDASRINLTDPPDVIAHKIRRAKTDAECGVTYDSERRPGVSNLVTIFAELSGCSIEDVCRTHAESPLSVFKEALIGCLMDKIVPIGREIQQRLREPAHLKRVMEQGRQRAGDLAAHHMAEIRELVGLTEIPHE